MGYYTNKVEAFSAIAGILNLRQEMLALKMLRTSSDIMELVAFPRNPNTQRDKQLDSKLYKFIDSISKIEDSVHKEISLRSSTDYSANLLKKIKTSSQFENYNQFKEELESLITSLKEEIDPNPNRIDRP